MPASVTRRLTEKEFIAQVIELARICGWLVAHFRAGRTATGWRTPVQGDGAGFPDLVLVKGSRMLMAELKVGNNRVSPAQRRWLDALMGADVQVHVWRPDMWNQIVEILK